MADVSSTAQVQGKVPAAGCISMSRTWSASARGSHFLVSSPPRRTRPCHLGGKWCRGQWGPPRARKRFSYPELQSSRWWGVIYFHDVKWNMNYGLGLPGWASGALGGIDQLRSVCWVGGTKSKWLQRSGRLCRCVAWPVPRIQLKGDIQCSPRLKMALQKELRVNTN